MEFVVNMHAVSTRAVELIVARARVALFFSRMTAIDSEAYGSAYAIALGAARGAVRRVGSPTACPSMKLVVRDRY